MAENSRFLEVSDNILDSLLGNAIPEKTEKATKYVLNIFNGERSLTYLSYFLSGVFLARQHSFPNCSAYCRY